MMIRHLLIGAVLLLSACQKGPVTLTLSGETMGTTYHIVAIDPEGETTQETLEAAVEATLSLVNARMSNWDPNSEISVFNATQSTAPMPISADLAFVMDAANRVHAASLGQFDVTLGPVIELWGFGARNSQSPIPSDAEIAAALDAVGQDRILTLTRAPDTLAKSRPETSVYLAAIAKGYGVDQVAQTLRSFGMEDYLVEIGGDLVTSGHNPAGAPWRIGIERPDAAAQTIEEVVDVSGLGMATSGDYRNYFEEDGLRYSHIIDAVTGRPITHTTASVTVLAPDAMMADAWATALLALGFERGMKVAGDNELAVLFITRDPGGAEGAFTSHANAKFTALSAPAPQGE